MTQQPEDERIAEALWDFYNMPSHQNDEDVKQLKTALAARGLRIVGGDQSAAAGKMIPVNVWQTMANAPKDRDILVYVPKLDDLPAFVTTCHWHEDAGFCVDGFREATMWKDRPAGVVTVPADVWKRVVEALDRAANYSQPSENVPFIVEQALAAARTVGAGS